MDDTEGSNTLPQPCSNNYEEDASQGLDDLSMYDDNEGDVIDENIEGSENDEADGCQFDDEYAVNGVEDMWKLNVIDTCLEDLLKYHFPDVGVAFTFYNWFAGINGFAARKSKKHKNRNGELLQQTFLCYRQGHRDEKVSNTVSRKREVKPHVRCDCEAKCRVHIDVNSGRWYIKYINNEHNHTLVKNNWTGMLPAHRKMTEYDIQQMNSMRKVGIRTPHIYGLFANQAGGFENVRFRKRDMYNEVERQRRSHFSDAKVALDFLNGLKENDDMMYWNHTVDKDGRLEHLYWCDGISRSDYSLFGDVLAFDATYRKNRYLCPLVVFSGVNHHNQTIVFASAIVSNETETTYVWLLEQFLASMGGKMPTSVITDGDLAMRNAIKKVFPGAHHRLCAWHLLRNATSNVGNPQFVSRLRQCMLGNYEVGEFKHKWDQMVEEFGLEDNTWVTDLYEKRKMWATAHIRGNFFAGFRTTSRCEGLHSEFGRYVNIQNHLAEFLQHFFRCLSYMRYKEVEADFSSSHGEPVMQTQLPALEKSAATLYTREVFLLFRKVLERACTCLVAGCKRTATLFIYTVTKYRKEDFEWHVSFSPSALVFKCSCERFESVGITCEHVVAVMVSLNIIHLPECVVLSRWTKNAKDSIDQTQAGSSFRRDPGLMCEYVALIERCKKMADAAIKCGKRQYMHETIRMVTAQTEALQAVAQGSSSSAFAEVDPLIDCSLRNPARIRSKGCGGSSSQATN